MIKFTLKCKNDHRFDSWFQNGSAFEKLKAAGHVSCAVCGSDAVEKAMMAPKVSTSKSVIKQDESPDLKTPMSEAEAKLKTLREEIEANSTDVGRDFADQARAMHYGDVPAKSIIGEATGQDAKELLSEGIPVAPLPWSTQKTN